MKDTIRAKRDQEANSKKEAAARILTNFRPEMLFDGDISLEGSWFDRWVNPTFAKNGRVNSPGRN